MPVLGFIGGVGFSELAVVLVIVLILFGAGKLPQVLESFGKGMKAFRDAQRDDAIDVSPRPRQLRDEDDDEDEGDGAQRKRGNG